MSIANIVTNLNMGCTCKPPSIISIDLLQHCANSTIELTQNWVRHFEVGEIGRLRQEHVEFAPCPPWQIGILAIQFAIQALAWENILCNNVH